jgi:putative flippase GtrA
MGGRVFSGVVDQGLMYLLISILNFNILILGLSIAKIITQIIVVVLNYVLSKDIVFK